jgi:hypothetical protein
MTARGLLAGAAGLCALASLWRAEKRADGAPIAYSPFLAALAIEAGIFLLRRRQSGLTRA